MRKGKKVLFMAAVAACLMYLAPLQVEAKPDEMAAIVQLKETEGSVVVQNHTGREMTMIKDMKLYSGYHVSSGASSYAWLELDAAKLAKLDAVSELQLRKHKKDIELLLESGNLFFNVTEPLEADETLNIRTSSMVAGIRGTCGWVKKINRKVTRFYLLEGTVQCAVADPVSGQAKETTLNAGEAADFYIYDKGRPGDKCDIIRDTFGLDDIPGSVLLEVSQDEELCAKILEATGMDILSIPETEVLRRLEEEQTEAEKWLEEIERAAAEQESIISKDPVWETATPTPAPASTPAPAEEPAQSEESSSPDTVSVTIRVKTNIDSDEFVFETQTVSYGGMPTKPETDSYQYGFAASYYKDAARTTPWNWNEPVTSDTVIYGQWNYYICTVTCMVDGEVIDRWQEISNVSPQQPVTPERTGYTFDGWYEDSACTRPWYVPYYYTEDTTIYGRWRQNLTLTLLGVNDLQIAVLEVPFGEAPSDSCSTELNHIFAQRPEAYWYSNRSFTTQWDPDQALTSDLTVYYRTYTINLYAVPPSGGSSLLTSSSFEAGMMFDKPEIESYTQAELLNPAQSGFLDIWDWYTTAACTVPYNFTNEIWEDTDIYAKMENCYRVLFYEYDGISNYTPAFAKLVWPAATVDEPAMPQPPAANPALTFGGWSTTQGGSAYNFTLGVSSDLILYPIWN